MHNKSIFKYRVVQTAVFVLTSCFISHALAQPGGNDLKLLKAQMDRLQSQIQQLENDEQDPFGGDRVKSVGTQRKKVKPVPVYDDSLHIRLYDLSDIFSVAPHYPAAMPSDITGEARKVFANATGNLVGGSGMGGGGFGGGGVFNFSPKPAGQDAEMMNLQAAQVSMMQLVDAIKETVEPEEWGKGSNEAKIKFLGNTLLISATTDMHSQITNLLNLFRNHWGRLRTVSVHAYWIRADSLELSKLISDPDAKKTGAGVVDDKLWKDFLIKAKEENRLAYSAAMTGHNNQTLHALSGKQRQIVVDVEPYYSTFLNAETDDESTAIVGLRPIRHQLHHGASIQVTPLATRGGNFVVLDLHTQVNELIGNEEVESKTAAVVGRTEVNQMKVELDRGEYNAYRMSSTLRCPKERVVLAGGMTYDETVDAKQSNLYLFVKVNVHTIQEDKSDFTDDQK